LRGVTDATQSRIDTRRYGVDPALNQPMVADQSLCCPGAGCHDCRHGAQYCALGRIELDRFGAGQPSFVGERQVHQGHHPKPAYMGYDDVGDATCHETVEQYHRGIGNFFERTSQFLAGSCIPSWPCPMDGDIANRNPDRRQALANAAIVDVASARRGQVVDVAGQNDVNGLPPSSHRLRS
jgi:hypothetical protein